MPMIIVLPLFTLWFGYSGAARIGTIIFAAIFAITTDPFIVFTSNIFAIMGLRALYFLLADMAERFHFLKYGLALVLMFVGAKMLLAGWIHIPTIVSLAVIAAIVLGSVLISLLATRAGTRDAGPAG